MTVLNKDGSVSDANWGPPMQPPAMSLRDYFAGQAMAALIVGLYSNAADAQRLRDLAPEREERQRIIATRAYDMADAMIEARKKGAK